MIHMRQFTSFEERNLRFLVGRGIQFTQVQVTATGLKKSILDATAPMRAYFKENGVHDYERQRQGQEGKVKIDTYIYTASDVLKTSTALYRPVTKQGDPRLWIYGLNRHTKADDIHAIIAKNPSELCVINLSVIDIQRSCDCAIDTPLKDLIDMLSFGSRKVAEELLGRLSEYQGKWIKTDLSADTAIQVFCRIQHVAMLLHRNNSARA